MPPKAAKPPVRGRRPKADVQQEFEEIQSRVEAERESADAKAEEAARLRETEVRQAVEAVTVEAVVQRIAGLGLEIGKALAEVSGRLAEETQLLASLREAVALERKELDRLHKIDVAATALDQMVQDYAREKQRLEGEIAAAARRMGGGIRAGGARAQGAGREPEEATAARDRRLRVQEDPGAQEGAGQVRRRRAPGGEEERREAGNPGKGLEAARGGIEGAGGRTGAAQEGSRGFPGASPEGSTAAAEQARKETEARLEQQALVLRKDAESEKRLAELRVKTLEEAAARQQAQIAALEKQLAEAKQQVQDIAVKAIEGASGARALSHINQIAMEQAKNRPQG